MLDKKICVFSFDDNKIYDYKMVEILDRYAIKCTFNINSFCVGKNGYVDEKFIKELSTRHEIACHTLMHEKDLHSAHIDKIRAEIVDDKKALEDMIENKVQGFAYPYGQFSQTMIDVLKQCGIKYARTVEDTFSLKDTTKDFYRWAPTWHQSKSIPIIEKLVKQRNGIIIIWGHSIEFKDDWSKLINICERLKDIDGIEFITAIELYNKLINKF